MGKSFDPYSIQRFSVIRLPYRFEGDRPQRKFFVVLGHRQLNAKEAFAVCVKATSKVEAYRNDSDKMRGCVFYPTGQVSCFDVDTVIQPDNQIPIPHRTIADAHFDGLLDWWPGPANFEACFREAIRNSVTMSRRSKTRLVDLLG